MEATEPPKPPTPKPAYALRFAGTESALRDHLEMTAQKPVGVVSADGNFLAGLVLRWVWVDPDTGIVAGEKTTPFAFKALVVE